MWVRIIDLDVSLIRRFGSRMENDYYEVSPVISVCSPPVKLSLPSRYSPRLMLTWLLSLLFDAQYVSH